MRIGNYEDGVTGRHHAARVLEPFIASIVSRRERRRVAVLLSDTESLNKVTQTLLEMVRGGIEGVPLDVTVFYAAPEPLDARLAARLPVDLQHLRDGERSFSGCRRAIAASTTSCFSSRPGCIAARRRFRCLAQLAPGRLDAVWGSRRLSVRDIEESYRFRYSASALSGDDQLPRQLHAEPGVPGPLRPLHHRYLVGRSRHSRRRRARSARRSRAQERQSVLLCRGCCGARPRSSRCPFTSSRCRRTG